MIAENFGVSWLVMDLPFPCELHYRTAMRIESNDNFKVMILNSEPDPLCLPFDDFLKVKDFFHLFISSDPRLLAYPNVAADQFGDIWVTQLPEKKDFSASFLYSLGANIPALTGYNERTNFLLNADKVKIPLRMHRGKRPYEEINHLPLLEGDRKDCLFESMFHVAFENYVSDHYFTEKVIDCFASYTVPIYYGCPKIGDHFDAEGILMASSHQEVIDILNSLTPDDYWKRMPAMQRNFERSQSYWNWLGRLRNLIIHRHSLSGN